MVEYVTANDIHIINKALNEGDDVRIQRTKDGYRIIKDSVAVLKKESVQKAK